MLKQVIVQIHVEVDHRSDTIKFNDFPILNGQNWPK